jgi:hypothetical protein
MSHRTFRGADGAEWQVWNVIPGAWREPAWTGGELRHVDRRSPEPVLRYTGPERRVTDRRTRASLVSPDLAAGWLTFQHGEERRRLTPIPASWDSLSDAELERLCERAEPVGPRRPGD